LIPWCQANEAAVEALIERRADPNPMTRQHGVTPLHLAATIGSRAIAGSMRGTGLVGTVWVRARHRRYRLPHPPSPLPLVAGILLRAGAIATAPSLSGHTPAEAAHMAGHRGLAGMLAEAEAALPHPWPSPYYSWHCLGATMWHPLNLHHGALEPVSDPL
jgi:ankyrin repeat protein